MSALPSIRSSFLHLCNSSTKALPPPKPLLQLMQPTKKTSHFVRYYFRSTAIAGGIGGIYAGNWVGEMENKHPDKRDNYSVTQKKINKWGYTAAGAFFGILSGPVIPPLILGYGLYFLAHKAKIID